MFGTILNTGVCEIWDSLSSHRPKTSALLRKTIYSEATEMFIFSFLFIHIYNSNLYICEGSSFRLLKPLIVMSGSCSILILFNQLT